MADNRLPALPSALLKLAVKDMKMSIKLGHRINMNTWQAKEPWVGCAVCFAGAVMANTLGKANAIFTTPTDFPRHIGDKLYALNRFRLGEIRLAYMALGVNKPSALPDTTYVAEYDNDRPGTFFCDMRKIVKMLEKVGQ